MHDYERNLFDFPEAQQCQQEVQQLLTPDEIYSDAAKYVKLLAEDRRIERKPARFHVEPLGEYFSMWANTSPDGGIVVLGIADGGQIEGCKSLEVSRLNKLEKTGYTRCPDAKYDSKRVPIQNKNGEADFILVFRIFYHPTRVIETCDGKIFVRIGDSKIERKGDEEKRQLRIDKGEVQYEQESCSLEYPGEFDTELIRRWCGNVRKRKDLTVPTSDERLLEIYHLGKLKEGTFRPNTACALLFAKDPASIIPGCKIRFLRFDGITEGVGARFNAVKDEWITGPISRQIDEAGSVIKAQVRIFSGLGADNKFHTSPEYPEEAWYEAVVNACVHRSYHFRNMNIFIKMFDDRLEVESPGPFPPPVTPKNIYEIQHSRNPFLMEALFFFDFVKCANEGVRRMRDTMLGLKLP